jgi:hypothetical protein
MRPHDLQAFEVDDELLDRLAVAPGQLTDAERTTVLERARDNLAREFDVQPDQAGRAMHEAARHGDFTLQASDRFVVVWCWGRLLVSMTRTELRAICHPEQN